MTTLLVLKENYNIYFEKIQSEDSNSTELGRDKHPDTEIDS